MPSLRSHMFRVAAVAKIILNHLNESLSTEEEGHVISACLLHDMGNIVKFNLPHFPEFLKPEGLEYWQEVQKNFWEKYGHEQHDVHHKIAEEIGIHSRTLELVDAIGFRNGCKNLKLSDVATKICSYSDLRVAPQGIVSLSERIEEAKIRYSNKKPGEDDHIAGEIQNCFNEIEKELFSLVDISPEWVTDETASPIITELQNYSPI